MFKKFKWNFQNMLSVFIILLLLIPQTRKPLQIQVQKLFAMMPPSIQSKSDRQSIKDFNWNLKRLDGMSYNLNATQGRTKVISFWATWCPPCIAELPSLQALYDSYKGQVDFIFISNEKTEVIQQFLDKNKYSIPVFVPLEVSKEIYFKPRTIPRTLLIDKKNEIIMIEDGASNWNSIKVKRTIDFLLQK